MDIFYRISAINGKNSVQKVNSVEYVAQDKKAIQPMRSQVPEMGQVLSDRLFSSRPYPR